MRQNWIKRQKGVFFRGRDILNFSRGNLANLDTRKASKQIMRQALDFHLKTNFPSETVYLLSLWFVLHGLAEHQDNFTGFGAFSATNSDSHIHYCSVYMWQLVAEKAPNPNLLICKSSITSRINYISLNFLNTNKIGTNFLNQDYSL